MSGETTSSQPVATQDRPTGELVKGLSEQLSHLVRDELRLAQLEMTRKGKQAGLGIGLFAGSGGIAVYGLGCLIACAVIAIATVLAAWLAALIVGVALLLVAGMAALAGKGRLSKATPPVPEETIGSVKADVEEIKERTHR
ncbi:MAG TPA: phage holin family protein [Streptosporangiaceae bacterium]|nr:phage holin family protein [Streptosporangiaceae bacterium]